MEYMALTELVKYGTPAILFVLIILNVIQTVILTRQGKDISSIKTSITWKDTCDERHAGINRRLERVEEWQNNAPT